MTYTLTPDQLKTVSDAESVFGTERLLPAWEDIPEEFKQGNRYTKLVESIFFDSEPEDDWTFCMVAPFTEEDLEALAICTNAHLKSWEPKHEHKIAGVGYMIAQVIRFENQGENDE